MYVANPSQYCFGTDHLRPLTRAEEVGAPFETRLKGIWPYLVKSVNRHVAGLTPRERANYDADDLMTEVALALWRKDDRWDAARGRYITFAEQVCRSTVLSLRSKMRPVHAPSNAMSRLRAYRRRAEEEGPLPARQATIVERLAQVLGQVDDLADTGDAPQLISPERPVPDGLVAREDAGRSEGLARAALVSAGPLGALVLTRLYGLFGSEPQTEYALARSVPGLRCAARVHALAEEARRRILEGAATRDQSHAEEDGP